MIYVTYGGGSQTIRHVPRDTQGRPIVGLSSATYRILDLRYLATTDAHVLVDTTAATLPTVSTTTSAVAGPHGTDPRVVTVASATGIAVGRMYAIQSTTKLTELVEVVEIASTTLRVRHPIENHFASGSTFVGAEISATFSSAFADDDLYYNVGDNIYAVDWTYQSTTTRDLLQIRRQGPHCPVTPQDLLDRVPEVTPRLGTTVVATDYLGSAWRSVATELRCSGLDPDLYHTSDLAQAATAYRAAGRIFAAHTDEAAQRLSEHYLGEAEKIVGAMTTGNPKPKTVQVSDEDGRVPTTPRGRYFAIR